MILLKKLTRENFPLWIEIQQSKDTKVLLTVEFKCTEFV